MPVFISHRRADNAIARNVYDKLEGIGIPCYLDDLDPEASTTDDITSVILKRLHQCSHLIVVLTQYTQESWWVPFEIGVGTELGHRMGVLTNMRFIMPEFLKKWPVMDEWEHVDEFARRYKQGGRLLVEKRAQVDLQERYADANNFHRELKRAIGQ